jgi:hypothetical protein
MTLQNDVTIAYDRVAPEPRLTQLSKANHPPLSVSRGQGEARRATVGCKEGRPCVRSHTAGPASACCPPMRCEVRPPPPPPHPVAVGVCPPVVVAAAAHAARAARPPGTPRTPRGRRHRHPAHRARAGQPTTALAAAYGDPAASLALRELSHRLGLPEGLGGAGPGVGGVVAGSLAGSLAGGERLVLAAGWREEGARPVAGSPRGGGGGPGLGDGGAEALAVLLVTSLRHVRRLDLRYHDIGGECVRGSTCQPASPPDGLRAHPARPPPSRRPRRCAAGRGAGALRPHQRPHAPAARGTVGALCTAPHGPAALGDLIWRSP